MVSSILERLKCFDDPNFKFDSYKHRYTYNGLEYESVTRFIQQFHKPFDEEYWSKKKSEDRGIEQSEILKEWKDKNDYANLIGSSTHQYIEQYFKGIHQKLPTNLDIIDRINKFNIIYAKHLHKLEPVKFELRIFSKNYRIAGMIDSLFFFRDKLIIIDYKTNGNFYTDEDLKGQYEKLLPPFEELYKNHFNEYCIQLNLYSLILGEWGFDISNMFLLYIGPEKCKFYKCLDLKEKLNIFLESYNFSQSNQL